MTPTAELWTPVEITLTGTVDYENPFIATEIDATFTHADGTSIIIPGFWKEGNTWAVRFSPTKVGEWRYAITCKDPANTGLTASGVIDAIPSTGDTEMSRRGFVTAGKGDRIYRYADGTPFFWLGDTNWQAFTNVSTTVCNYPGCTCQNQFRHIVDDRLAKGFTVYQTYFVPEAGNGEKPLWLNNNFTTPNTDVFNGKVDAMFEYLGERGLLIVLGLGCHSSTMGCMDLDSFLRFTRMIVARYACYPLVWIAGQEITNLGNSKTPGHTVFDCYFKAATLVDELDGYKHPNSAHMDPMLATDERAVRLDTAPWHTSWTVQGGHGNLKTVNVGYMQSKAFYESYYKAENAGYCKPFIESESNYEDINCGPFTGYDPNRVGAWKAMLCGSAGFTYGVGGIWAGCFSTSRFSGWYGELNGYSYDPWYAGLDKPGSFEMTYLKEFFEEIGPWYDLVPRFGDTAFASSLDSDDCLLASTEDGALAVVYRCRNAVKETTILRCLNPEKTYDAYWFDPRTGAYIPAGKGISAADGLYTMPDQPTSADWVFLITALGLPDHREEEIPVDLNPANTQVPPTGEKIRPAHVKAVGGITSQGEVKGSQTMTDPTPYLCDGNPDTVWAPAANRATQTILFDLGEARELTHVTITPKEGTILPNLRVEGSLDGRTWRILTDTSLRETENHGACSEPLVGTHRYLKVLLLNAESREGDPALAESLPYEAVFNPMNHAVYSATKITDVLIYASCAGA